MVNKGSVLRPFLVRTRAIAALRAFLRSEQFTEVETPILWTEAGGANAKPFLTRGNAWGKEIEMNLRIAPELFLKVRGCAISGVCNVSLR